MHVKGESHASDGFPWDVFRMPDAPRNPRQQLLKLRQYAESIVTDGRRFLPVVLSGSRVLPSGFLQLLFQVRGAGVEVLLLDPSPAVREMLWFRLYAREVGGRVWAFTADPSFDVRPLDRAGKFARLSPQL
jgi:hypothetical protein